MLSSNKLIRDAIGDHCFRGTNVFKLSDAVFTLFECLQCKLIELMAVFFSSS